MYSVCLLIYFLNGNNNIQVDNIFKNITFKLKPFLFLVVLKEYTFPFRQTKWNPLNCVTRSKKKLKVLGNSQNRRGKPAI